MTLKAAYHRKMHQRFPAGNDVVRPGSEDPAARDVRIRREASIIAQAEADIDAGLGLEYEDVEAWLDALECDENAPMPQPKRQQPA